MNAKETKPMLFSNRALFSLIWPLVIEQLLNVLVGMVDVLMVAVLGEDAVSGVALVDSLTNLIIQVLFAMTAGGTVICAQYIGSKEYKKAGKATGQILLITLVMTVSIMLVFIFGGNSVLKLFFGQAEEAVMRNARIYIRYMAISYPFLAIYHSGAAAFRAVGNTRISMICNMFMNFFNIIGNAFCIFILKMGVEGVAIPTLLARLLGACFIMWMLAHTRQESSLRSVKDILPQKEIAGRILNIGVPNSFESGIFQFGRVFLQSLVSTLGTASIAGYAVASNLVQYLYLPGNALGAALLTVVGQCYGADEKKQAKQYVKRFLFFNYAMLLFICTVMIFGRNLFVGMYNLSGESSVMAVRLLVSHALAMILWPMAFLTPYYFRAIGKARFTMVVSITIMWIFRVGFAYLFVKIFHTTVLGIWIAMYIDWVVRVIIYMITFRRIRV